MSSSFANFLANLLKKKGEVEMERNVSYTIYTKSIEEGIEMKNKILASANEKEDIKIDIYINEAYIIN